MTPGEQSDGSHARDEVLAGEYVLGVLSLEARRQVEARVASDRTFAAIVDKWQLDLESLNDDYEEVAPGVDVFGKIEQRLFGRAESSYPTLWNSAGFWRWLSVGMSLIAIAALVYASGIMGPSTGSTPLLAELSAPGNAVNMLATYDPAGGRMRIVPVAAGKRDEKSLELWLVPSRGSPLSLGVFPAGTSGELVIPPELREDLAEGATLAVTLEPFGGSPTGRATGPIVASGIAHRP
ncbi:anti-sigma-K factor RskA [Neorhizobium sp. 2083]|uniref:anti-sigma factor n=1 Tax=Neorhizobium sp. 2083 TaxID=2817762 RepID=UPI00285A0CC2|nr:anti-sigma factor [Neorhizobium sp. 2083]MDR6820825.1 anti-sigma-K factor RskA [Neorhizobium sp. 2083]